MRRSAILLVVAAMATAIALPAEAKKPTPDDPPIYTVAIAFERDSGVATTCLDDDGNALTLEVARNDEHNGVSHFESWAGARLDVTGNLAWEGAPISGCHGNFVPPEYFRITLEDDGTVAMLWIFDVEVTEEIITLKNGRTKTKTSRTDFRMGGPYHDGGFATAIGWDLEQGWEANNGSINFSVEGSFSFVHFVSGGDPLFTDLTNTSQMFTLDITLTPP